MRKSTLTDRLEEEGTYFQQRLIRNAGLKYYAGKD